MALVAGYGLTSVMVGLLRQELDSTVRVMFLLAQRDRSLRARLIEDSVHGRRWRVPTPAGKETLVTDRELIELGESLTGWARNVYRFGCSFEAARTEFLARLRSYPGATRRAPWKDLCTAPAVAQGMNHSLQDPERA
jgi:hypothetical protein